MYSDLNEVPLDELLDTKQAILDEIIELEAQRQNLLTKVKPMKQHEWALFSKRLIVENGVEFKPMAGVYFLIDGDEVVYVGQSKDISHRIAHHKDKIFDKVTVIECDIAKIDMLETLYITSFTPRYNDYEHIDSLEKRDDTKKVYKRNIPISVKKLLNLAVK